MITRINVATGKKEILAIPDDLSDITRVFVNEEEDTLFYTNDEYGNIRKISL